MRYVTSHSHAHSVGTVGTARGAEVQEGGVVEQRVGDSSRTLLRMYGKASTRTVKCRTV